MLAVLLRAYIEGAPAQEELLDHAILGQRWSLHFVIVLEFDQARKEFLGIGLSRWLEAVMPPFQGAIFKFCHLARAEEVLLLLRLQL